MPMTAVIPLNNELISEERDFAYETTWKSRHIQTFFVFTTTDRMKCCSYWENGDERESWIIAQDSCMYDFPWVTI